MMTTKRCILSMALLLGVLSMTAQPRKAQGLSDNQMLLGYIATDSITVKGAAFGTAGTYPVGAILDAQDLAPYAGCRVVGVRMAAALDLGRARTFIYNITDTAITPVIEQKQRLYEGWNNVFFNGDGYEIKGDEMLFFGFDYTETDAMVAAEEGGLCGYGDDVEGAFYAYADLGSGLNLYSLSNIGCLCVQLIVDVSSLPLKDLDMAAADVGFKYKKAGETIDVMATYRNVGRQGVNSCRLGCRLDEGAPVFFEKKDSVASGRSEVTVFEFPLPADIAVGTHRLSVFVDQVEGQSLPASTAQRDTIVSTFAIYENMLYRSKAYMEIYTDQTSPYVPYLNDAVKLLTKDGNQLAVVNVHRPGTPLSVMAADYLHWLYAYTWPTFTVNRSYFPGEAHIAYDMNDYLPVIGADMTAAILGDMIVQDYASPTFATLALGLTYDETSRQMTIEATGDALPEAEAIYGELALTLMLAEDGVKGAQVVYNERTQRTTTNQNYQHNQVLRHFVTQPIGDAIQVADGKWKTSYSLTLDEGWNAENLTVVGLLTKKVDEVDNGNLRDVDVIDCNTASLSDITGVQTVTARPAEDNSCYSLSGRRIDPKTAKPGIYVRGGKKVIIR